MRFCGYAASSRHWPASSRSARLIGIPRSFDSSGGTVVVVQHAAQALAALNLACIVEMASLGADELVRQTLVIAFTVIMRDEVLNAVRNDSSPKKNTRSRQDSLMLRTNLSA